MTKWPPAGSAAGGPAAGVGPSGEFWLPSQYPANGVGLTGTLAPFPFGRCSDVAGALNEHCSPDIRVLLFSMYSLREPRLVGRLGAAGFRVTLIDCSELTMGAFQAWPSQTP